jgi:hypothetical protein
MNDGICGHPAKENHVSAGGILIAILEKGDTFPTADVHLYSDATSTGEIKNSIEHLKFMSRYIYIYCLERFQFIRPNEA